MTAAGDRRRSVAGAPAGLALLLSLALLGVALAGPVAAQGTARFDGQYRGELTLTRVAEDRDCTRPPPGALYPLTIANGEVRFPYIPRFDTTLVGPVDDKGNFKAVARLKHGTAQMTGHIERRNVTATIVSPSCHYSFRSVR